MGKNAKTIASAFTFEGKGLHTAADSKVTVSPSQVLGFLIKVGDASALIVPEICDGSLHRTIVKVGGISVHTIEHLLGALYGMGVDAAVIEVEGGEIPGLDGSANSFAEKVKEVGLVDAECEVKVFNPADTVSAAFGGSSITAFPSKDGKFRVTYILDYPESKLAQGTSELEIDPEATLNQLSPCRTFVMKCHAEKLLEAGLGQGANTDNTLVLDGEEVVDNKLRFDDECIRHKILDIVGDLATVGCRLGVHVVAYKSGHALNLELARRIKQAIFKLEYPKGLMDVREIEKVLPHRYPFLLVDRVMEIEPKRRILAYKNLTRNEEFFNGHFPGLPIMPGVLQIEALAQAGGILLMNEEIAIGKLAVLMGVENVKYRKPVVPGDRLMLEVVFQKLKGRIGVVEAKASVDGEMTTECLIKFALVDPEQYG